MKQFCDVVVWEKPAITVSYRTGMTVFEEGLRDGRWVALSYSASGHLMAANNRPAPSFVNVDQFARPESFRLNADGQDLNSHWTYIGCETKRENENLRVCVTLRHTVRPVMVRIHTLLDGTGVFDRAIEVVNTSDRPMALSALSPLSGAVQQTGYGRNRLGVSGEIYRVGYMKSSAWGSEGEFRWQSLPDEIYTIAGRYRRDRYRHPMFLLENRLTGETFVCQLAWSGGYAFTFDLNREIPQLASLSIDIAIDAPAPLRMIEPGEAYIGPKVHMGVVFGGLDPAIQEMHDHVRKSVLLPPTRGVSGWIESGIGPEFDMDIDSTLKSLEHAHSLGSEVFFIDAGWYVAPDHEEDWWKQCGDWRFNPERYPAGVDQVREAAHEKGMLFGMWMDADRIGPGSEVWKAHEEWRSTNYNGKRTGSGLLNLAANDVCAWMEKEIRYLLDHYRLDMFRLDYNIGAQDAVAYNERDGYLENTFLRYYDNVYAVYRRLRRDYPDVIFESCAGGGGRTDLGMVSNFTHSWVTDWQIHPRAFSITNGMTMALPPECVDRLIGGQNAYLTGDVRTLIRNLIFARPTIGCFKPPYAAPNPEQVEIVKHHVELYKRFVRPMQRNSRYFHHTPELSKLLDGFGILEMAEKGAGQGMIGIFRLAEGEKDEVRVYPRGVDPSKTYAVTLDNFGAEAVFTGAELIQNGLRVRLGGALTSELILYRAQ